MSDITLKDSPVGPLVQSGVLFGLDCTELPLKILGYLSRRLAGLSRHVVAQTGFLEGL